MDRRSPSIEPRAAVREIARDMVRAHVDARLSGVVETVRKEPAEKKTVEKVLHKY
jgi:hypothetical protein